MKVEPTTLHGRQSHDFFGSLIIPRPIAFVSTVDAKGRYNAAPYSAFIRLTLEPAVLCFALGRRKGQKKDTLNNIEAVGDFVVNMVDENILEAAHQASANYAPGVSEIEKVGLTAVKSDRVKSPRIAESPISLECKLMQIVELGSQPDRSAIVFGEILLVHVKDEVVTNGEVDPVKAKIVGRLGNIYCRTTNIIRKGEASIRP